MGTHTIRYTETASDWVPNQHMKQIFLYGTSRPENESALHAPSNNQIRNALVLITEFCLLQ